MKINGLPPIGKGGELNKKSETQVTGPSFGNVLQDAIGAGNVGKVQSAPAPFQMMPLTPINPASQNQIVNQATSMVENVLGDLEMYQNALANPNIPTNRLKPMAQNLMDSKDKLVSLLPKVNDNSLKSIISNTASLIISEHSRLNTAVS
jgi:hypothetical protein